MRLSWCRLVRLLISHWQYWRDPIEHVRASLNKELVVENVTPGWTFLINPTTCSRDQDVILRSGGGPALEAYKHRCRQGGREQLARPRVEEER